MKLNRRIICMILALAMVLTGILPISNSKEVYAQSVTADLDLLKDKICDVSYATFNYDENPFNPLEIKIPFTPPEFDNIENIYTYSEQHLSHMEAKTYLCVKTTDGSITRWELNGEIEYQGTTYRMCPSYGDTYIDFRNNEIFITLSRKVRYDANGDAIWEDVDDATSGVTVKQISVVDYEPTEVEDEGEMLSLEAMLAILVNGLADGVNLLVAGVLGRRVTIDDLVFNDYPDTNISYFKSPGDVTAEDSKLIWGINNSAGPQGWAIGSGATAGDGTNGLYKTINDWYNLFLKITLIVYLILLVYMGIRIVLSSTGENAAKYKELFMYWVLGVIILFFYPYVMKYAIQLNNAFVDTIQGSLGTILDDITIPQSAEINSASLRATEGIFVGASDASPFVSGAEDYMSVIADQAHKTKRFALALAYLLMTWQLITLIVHYYKRVFMTGFLIVIFPIVMMFYALDRIADGKSQSFNKWNKEFILNVFIQSFHAIVYVFVCGTVYSAGVGESYDFILVITGVTFMFTGEEIIKRIFSQESKTITRPAGESLLKAAVAVKATTAVARGITKPFVGKDSIPVKLLHHRAEISSGIKQRRLFDTLATPASDRVSPQNMDATHQELERIESSETMTEAQKTAEKARVMRTAKAISVMNNPSIHTSKELADAYATLQAEFANNPTNPQLADLNMSEDRMQQMAQLGVTVAGMVAAGEATVDIERTIRAELEFTLNGLSEEDKNKYYSMYLAHMATYGVNRGFTRAGTEQEVLDMSTDMENLGNSFRYHETGEDVIDDDDDEDMVTRLERRRAIYASSSILIDDIIEDLDPSTVTDADRELAKQIAIYRNRGTGTFSAETQLNALDQIVAHKEDSEIARRLVQQLEDDEDGIDVEVAHHVLARRIVDNASDITNIRLLERARTVANQYEDDVREGFYDDELSIHEIISRSADEARMRDMTDRVHNARRHSNQTERELTRRLAEEMLVAEGIDITEDAIEEKVFLEGKSRGDINLGFVRSSMNLARDFTGFKRDTSGSGYSRSYKKEWNKWH